MNVPVSNKLKIKVARRNVGLLPWAALAICGFSACTEVARQPLEPPEPPPPLTAEQAAAQSGQRAAIHPGSQPSAHPTAQGAAQEYPQAIVFRGMCDASAAVALDEQRFIIADDQNVFCLYRLQQPQQPVARVDWQRHLQIDPGDEHPEADIEGAARLGDEIFWITSHGRNRDGKWRPNRHRLFAMTVRAGEQGPAFAPFGHPYLRLADDLAAEPRLAALGLKDALGPAGKKVARLAPKDEGLNIEALASAPDNKGLWLGFRNPRPEGKALLVPLLNPREVLLGTAPRFGPPVLLDLAARYKSRTVALGIRAMDYLPQTRSWLIVAGAHDEEDVFAVYSWSGKPEETPKALDEATNTLARLPGFSPEAMVAWGGQDHVLLLSDDGADLVRVGSPAECRPDAWDNGFCEAKALLDPGRKTFQALWIALQ